MTVGPLRFYLLSRERLPAFAVLDPSRMLTPLHPPQPAACWWKQSKAGYTSNLDDAGQFTAEEAAAVVAASHGEEIAVPVEFVETMLALLVNRERATICAACARVNP